MRQIRKERKISVEKLAESIGLSSKQIYRIETGESWPPPETITRLAGGLGVQESDLFRGSTQDSPSQTSISKMTPEELNAFTRAILENNKKLEAENAGIQYKQHQNVDSVDKSHIEALEKQARELKEQLEKIHAARPEPKTEKERVLHLLDRIKNKDFGRIRLMLEETIRMYQEEEEELMLQKKTRA